MSYLSPSPRRLGVSDPHHKVGLRGASPFIYSRKGPSSTKGSDSDLNACLALTRSFAPVRSRSSWRTSPDSTRGRPRPASFSRALPSSSLKRSRCGSRTPARPALHQRTCVELQAFNRRLHSSSVALSVLPGKILATTIWLGWLRVFQVQRPGLPTPSINRNCACSRMSKKPEVSFGRNPKAPTRRCGAWLSVNLNFLPQSL